MVRILKSQGSNIKVTTNIEVDYGRYYIIYPSEVGTNIILIIVIILYLEENVTLQPDVLSIINCNQLYQNIILSFIMLECNQCIYSNICLSFLLIV